MTSENSRTIEEIRNWYQLQTFNVAREDVFIVLSALDKAVAALKGYVSNCPFGCLHGDVGDESQFVECEACKPARETLREIGCEL